MDVMVEEVKSRLEAAFGGAGIAVAGEGNRCEVRIVSDAFSGLSRVKRQQAVYAAIGELIAAGTIHAVTIRALTPDEALAGRRPSKNPPRSDGQENAT